MVNASNNREFQDENQRKKRKFYIIGNFFLLLIYFCSTIGRKRKQSFLVKLVCYYAHSVLVKMLLMELEYFFFLISFSYT